MRTVNIHDAKTNLSRLLRRVARGEDVIIARDGTPIARLTALLSTPTVPILGADRGRFTVPDDFNESLPSEIVDAFEGRPESE